MRFLLLIHADESRYPKLTPEENGKLMAAYDACTEEMKTAGAFLGADRLVFTAQARTVRVRDGKPMVTDGPFAETKEQLGGYYMIEARDIDEAADWAAKVPSAAYGSVEVRPLWD